LTQARELNQQTEAKLKEAITAFGAQFKAV